MADNNTEKQRVQELTNKLEQGLQDLFNSDSYRNYLSTMSKFHNYSFNNTLLDCCSGKYERKPDFENNGA